MDITFNNYTECIRVSNELDKEYILLEHIKLYNEMNSFINENIVELDYNSELYTEGTSKKGKTFLEKVQEFIEKAIEQIKKLFDSLLNKQTEDLNKNFNSKMEDFIKEIKNSNAESRQKMAEDFLSTMKKFKGEISTDLQSKFDSFVTKIKSEISQGKSSLMSNILIASKPSDDFEKKEILEKLKKNEEYLDYLYHSVIGIINGIVELSDPSPLESRPIRHYGDKVKYDFSTNSLLIDSFGKINKEIKQLKEDSKKLKESQRDTLFEINDKNHKTQDNMMEKYLKKQDEAIRSIKYTLNEEVLDRFYKIKIDNINTQYENATKMEDIKREIIDTIKEIKESDKNKFKNFKKKITENIISKLPFTSPLFVTVQDFISNFKSTKICVFDELENEKLTHRLRKWFVSFIRDCKHNNYYADNYIDK